MFIKENRLQFYPRVAGLYYGLKRRDLDVRVYDDSKLALHEPMYQDHLSFPVTFDVGPLKVWDLTPIYELDIIHGSREAIPLKGKIVIDFTRKMTLNEAHRSRGDYRTHISAVWDADISPFPRRTPLGLDDLYCITSMDFRHMPQSFSMDMLDPEEVAEAAASYWKRVSNGIDGEMAQWLFSTRIRSDESVEDSMDVLADTLKPQGLVVKCDYSQSLQRHLVTIKYQRELYGDMVNVKMYFHMECATHCPTHYRIAKVRADVADSDDRYMHDLQDSHQDKKIKAFMLHTIDGIAPWILKHVEHHEQELNRMNKEYRSANGLTNSEMEMEAAS